MDSEATKRTYNDDEIEFLKFRLAQIHAGIKEGVRREVEWLRKHNFAIPT